MGSRPGLGAGGRYSGSLRCLDIVLLTAKLLMKLLQPEVVGCIALVVIFIQVVGMQAGHSSADFRLYRQ